jgi:hemoglobin-like flavoprotein
MGNRCFCSEDNDKPNIVPIEEINESIEQIEIEQDGFGRVDDLDVGSPVPRKRNASAESINSVSISIGKTIDKETAQYSRYHTGKITELQLQVAFYTPCCFPMVPTVTQDTMYVCRKCWAQLMLPVQIDGKTMSGLTIFYTEFYNVFATIDQGGYFEKTLLARASGLNSIAAKGALIIRIMNFSLSLDPDNPAETERRLATVGRTHKTYSIRPWMYRGFVEALLTTLQLILDDRATSEVMSAWCNLFALVLQKMLPPAIEGIVHPHEMDANFSGNIINYRAASSSKSSNSSRSSQKRRFFSSIGWTKTK